MNENIFQKFKDKFIEESNMLLNKLEKDLLELEKQPEEKELLESAFRAMHTLKGISSMYGFEFISEFTHILENIYQQLRDKKISFNKEISNLSFQAIDHIHKLLEDEKLINDENKSRHKLLCDQINQLVQNVPKSPTIPAIGTQVKSGKTKQSWYIIINTNEQLFFRGINLTNILKELSGLGEFYIQRIPVLNNQETDSWGIVLVSDCTLEQIQEVFIFIEDNSQIFRITKDNVFEDENTFDDQISSVKGGATKAEPSIMDMVESPDKFLFDAKDTVQAMLESDSLKNVAFKHNIKRISVDSEKLDHLMYLVSELITVNSQLTQATKDSKYEGLRTFIENIDTLSKKFRNNALEIRLVSLGEIALRFQRLIRDLSLQLNKKIQFVTEGIDAELDKNTIDMLTEPLMHIIRNCIDHGIETPERRKEQGKPETGIIKLTSSNLGSNVFITIADDGYGIDMEKVRLKAVERGIISENDKPSEKEIFDLIFLPGFSTAQSLTEVSGRGVGMDVVKRRINDLRGEIIVESVWGKGASFTLKLQQSVAIIDSLLFQIENTYLIVPMYEIETCLQEDAIELDKRRNTGTIAFNDNLIRLIDLRELLNIEGSYSGKVKIIIIRKNNRFIAFMADKIIGEHQAVLKPMGKVLQQQKYLLAASQHADGKMVFMLDTAILHEGSIVVTN
jgi:two-component system chemotaxis sensor kinase CheA